MKTIMVCSLLFILGGYATITGQLNSRVAGFPIENVYSNDTTPKKADSSQHKKHKGDSTRPQKKDSLK